MVEYLVSGLVGALVGIGVEHLIFKCLIPLYYSYIKWMEIRKKKKLYYGDNTTTHIRSFYRELLYNCKIGNTSKQIPYVVNDEWRSLNIDIMANKDILQPVQTHECTYPIHNRMIRQRQNQGQKLFDGPSHFLHRIVCTNGSIHFEIGEYSYFRRISFVHDFEKETYALINNKRGNNCRLRQEHLPRPTNASLTTLNTVPIGCDAVIAICLNGKYHVCIHERSNMTVNYPGGIMVTPTFGLEQLANPQIDNPLLFAVLREYAEELFNRKEVEDIDSYIDPMWFYYQFPEVADLLQLLRSGKAECILNGCGFDAIGGFLNLSVLVAVHDEQASKKIYSTCQGNWEAKPKTVRFVPIDSHELEDLLNCNKLCPASSFAISRAQAILND